MSDNIKFTNLISEETFQKLIDYKNNLQASKIKPGAYLRQELDKIKSQGIDIQDLNAEQLFQALLSTKKPKILTKRVLKCDGSDWNRPEFSILGDVTVGMEVVMYDNGAWSSKDKNFKLHPKPLVGKLLYVPGTLLDRGRLKEDSPDYKEIVTGDEINQDKFNKLIERRLHPVFMFANQGPKCMITIPGLGCGVFAGKFKGKVAGKLNTAIQYVLEKHHSVYNNIVCVYFDPFKEGRNEDARFGGVQYKMRPAIQNPGRPLLSDVKLFQEKDNFSDCILCKVVAWDHFSWPGNNYWDGGRSTDDGVSAAATNTMQMMSGVKGSYKDGKYWAPAGFKSWKEVLDRKGIGYKATGNVVVVSDDKYVLLSEFNEKKRKREDSETPSQRRKK